MRNNNAKQTCGVRLFEEEQKLNKYVVKPILKIVREESCKTLKQIKKALKKTSSIKVSVEVMAREMARLSKRRNGFVGAPREAETTNKSEVDSEARF